MKFLIIPIIILALLNFLSCTNGSSPNNQKPTESDSVLSCSVSEEQLPTHVIDVKCKGAFVPLRTRILNEEELRFSQKGNAASEKLNDEVIITELYNGCWIKILMEDTSGYHYVEVIDPLRTTQSVDEPNIRGYIVAKYCNQPTVRKFERLHISPFKFPSKETKELIEWLDYHHSPDCDLLDYAFNFVSQEADIIQTLSFSVTGINKIHYKLYQVISQQDKILYEGNAELYSRYRKGQSEISRFITYNVHGVDFEIHINESENTASLVWLDEESFFTNTDGDVMLRIK